MSQVKFITKTYHPNILQKGSCCTFWVLRWWLTQRADGTICQQILGDNWSPQLKIQEGTTLEPQTLLLLFLANTLAVLLIIRNMLLEPNIDSPLEEEVAEQYRNKKADFVKTAKEWTKKYATAAK